MWINACERKDSFNVDNARVCELHFEVEVEKDFVRNLKEKWLEYNCKNRRQLRADSIPTLLLFKKNISPNEERTNRADKRNKAKLMNKYFMELKNEGKYEELGLAKDEGGPGGAGYVMSPGSDLPEPERPPMRHIDRYIRAEIPCWSKRVTVAALTCLGFIVMFGMRCNMGIAKLQLEKERNQSLAVVDSSIFWGYLVTQVPGGFLATKYPANKLFGIAIGTSSFLNLFVPGALSIGPAAIILVRVMQGFVEGVTYPSCHGIWRYWAPPMERSKLATLAFCGCYAGVMIAMPLCGELIERIGWEAPFYFYGCFGIIWFFLWLWLVFEKPALHPCIDAKELYYIEKSLGSSVQHTTIPTIANTPWKEFFHSWPVWAIFVANFCRSWNFYLLVLFQASYVQDVYGIDIEENAILGALPHLLMTIIVPSGGILADRLRRRGILTTTQVRKLFNCGGFGMEATFFIAVAFSKTYTQAITALTFGVAFSGFAISGFNVNHLDIAPKYASILMGMSNGIGTIAGVICPLAVHALTDEHKSRENWKIVFVTGAVIHYIGVIFYGIFASGDLQPWADSQAEEEKQWNPMDETTNMGKPPATNGLLQRQLSGKNPMMTTSYGATADNIKQPPPPRPPPSSAPGPQNTGAMPHNPFNTGTAMVAPPAAGSGVNPFNNPFRQEPVQPEAHDAYMHGTMEDRNY